MKYKVIKIEQISDLEDELNEMVKEGWEVVFITQSKGRTKGYTVILKK